MAKQEVRVKIPWNYSPREYQIPFLSTDRRFKIAVWHRRSGKSKTTLNDQIIQLHEKPGIYYYFLPTYKQAKQVIWDSLVKEHVPMELVEKINETELSIYWKNGSIQRFAGCEDPDKHRGINPIGVVFDEYAEMREEMWTVIVQPILRENRGTATFIFTPKGRNHAFQLLARARENKEWFTQVLTVDDTGSIDRFELEEAKKETPQAFFEQEYYCSFKEDSGAFFRNVEGSVGETRDHSEHMVQLGVDLAKYQDWTVITPFCLNCFDVLPQYRFNQVDWNLQKARIEAEARKYGAGLTIDATGVGDPIVEDLQRTGLNVIGYKFTEHSRRQLLDNLQKTLEQKKIRIPKDQGLIDELLGFTYILHTTPTGQKKIKIAAPDNMTDDRVMSLALAVWGATEPVQRVSQDYHLYQQDFT